MSGYQAEESIIFVSYICGQLIKFTFRLQLDFRVDGEDR